MDDAEKNRFFSFHSVYLQCLAHVGDALESYEDAFSEISRAWKSFLSERHDSLLEPSEEGLEENGDTLRVCQIRSSAGLDKLSSVVS